MIHSLRQFHLGTMALRLLLALTAGGLIGYGRSKRDRAAGLSTYMIISIGTAMSVLLTLYLYGMLHGPWAEIAAEVGEKFDASRLASQSLTCISWLGAGIIVKAAHQQVKGLTTATGLFATVCMGVAAGAGFYECVLLAMLLVVNVMSPLEAAFKRRLRNITLNVELHSVEDITAITRVFEEEQAKIYDIDVSRISGQVISGLGFIGSGYYELGLLGTGLLLITETWMGRLGSAIRQRPQYTIEVLYDEKTCLDEVLRLCKDSHMAIVNLKIHTLDDSPEARYAAEVFLRGNTEEEALLDRVRRMRGIVSAFDI